MQLAGFGEVVKLQLAQATDLLLADLDLVLDALKTRALEHKTTLTIGRSHGIHAEPTTFGLKLAGHYAEFARTAPASSPHAPRSPSPPFWRRRQVRSYGCRVDYVSSWKMLMTSAIMAS